jgi:hypothetical protein
MSLETRDEESVPAQIEKSIEQALINATAFFKKHGIELKKMPRVKYLEMRCPMNEAYAGVANIDIESMKRLVGVTGVAVMRTSYDLFDLTFGDDAASESIEIMQNRLNELYDRTPMFKDGEDIDLFSPIRDLMDKLDSVMVHECWHLIESEQGAIVEEPLIREATATYIQNYFRGKSCANPTVENYFDVIYHLGAAIVEEELEGSKNPLASLLKPAVRKRIEERFQREAIPLIGLKSVQAYDPTLSREWQAQYINHDPDYECFRRKPSAKTLLQAMRKRGYKKLAKDFSTQDLTKMLAYSKSLLRTKEDENVNPA